jgi:hypothetical protein
LNRNNESAHKPALAARIAIDTGPAVLDAGGEICDANCLTVFSEHQAALHRLTIACAVRLMVDSRYNLGW